MTSSTILDLTRQALMLVLLLSLPIVLIATVTGLVVAILQAVTQVQDANIGIAVRLIAVMVALVLLSGWLGGEVLRFAQQALERMHGEKHFQRELDREGSGAADGVSGSGRSCDPAAGLPRRRCRVRACR